MNREIMEAMGFKEEMDNVDNNICPFCKGFVDESKFKDEISKKEFKISGLCQKCQDKTFG